MRTRRKRRWGCRFWGAEVRNFEFFDFRLVCKVFYFYLSGKQDPKESEIEKKKVEEKSQKSEKPENSERSEQEHPEKSQKKEAKKRDSDDENEKDEEEHASLEDSDGEF